MTCQPQHTKGRGADDIAGTKPCERCYGDGSVEVERPVTRDMERDAGMEAGSGGVVTTRERCANCQGTGVTVEWAGE